MCIGTTIRSAVDQSSNYHSSFGNTQNQVCRESSHHSSYQPWSSAQYTAEPSVAPAVDYTNFNLHGYRLESSTGWSANSVQSWTVDETSPASNFDSDHLHRDKRSETQFDLCRSGHKHVSTPQAIAPCTEARKSVNDAGSPYRRHTASLIRRIDTLLARRSTPHSNAPCAKPRKSRPGSAQRPRARNVVLKELVELLRKTKRDEQVNCRLYRHLMLRTCIYTLFRSVRK
uniref:Uncharacterized protein n=1 Tax=Cryptomonas curvata TaxID=233186 RepID=A0A7S0QGL9_9CRYP|mmetsp:Transcript_21374/g.44900  ORF Transcript_21374/g.44900 Transcript_21374/m.44900 type:complete len:229 (+) Transcript_21374:59-745(+)